MGGIEDIINVPSNAEVCNIPLPTNEKDKKYCIVTTKPMQLISLDARGRMDKECR